MSVAEMEPKANAELGEVTICACMSVPRVGWNDSWSCVFTALYPFGIPIHHFGGAFWGAGMQRGMEYLISKGINLILCIDYDSMFTTRHVHQLLTDFANTSDADAMASMQPKRGGQFPLGTVEGDPTVQLNGEPHPVNTAHFGLTLFRTDRLAGVPKPWFQGVPNDDGEWGEGRIDDDIYFWHNFKDAGRKCYITPNCRIGHLELMVSEFDKDLQFRQVSVDDWKKASYSNYGRGPVMQEPKVIDKYDRKA